MSVDAMMLAEMRAIVQEAKRLAWERGFRSGWEADGCRDLDAELAENPYGGGEVADGREEAVEIEAALP